MDTNNYIAMLKEYPETVIVFGKNAMEQLAGKFVQDQVRNVLIFMGGTTQGSANLNILQTILNRSGVEGNVYRGIPAEPTVADVRKMSEYIRRQQPDAVLALGGGSVMDAAKAAYLSVQSEKDVTELFGVNQASASHPGKKFKRVICLPTTSGTGSEATPYSNIVDPDSKVKKLIVDHAMIPAYSFINPAFTVTMPSTLTSTTALDALVHCVESVLNFKAENAHPSSTDWGIQGIQLIVKGLPIVLKDPKDMQGRTLLSAAAVLGGMCIKNRPTSLPHLCSFSFYGKVPHGVAVAALLPPFWKFYLAEPAVREQTMKLAGIFADQPEQTPEQVVDHAAEFIAANGGPKRLSDLECPETIIEKAAADAVLNPVKLRSCPRPVSPDTAASIISEVLKKAW